MSKTAEQTRLLNYVGGEWRESAASDYGQVVNPASGAVMARVPHSQTYRCRPIGFPLHAC